MASDHRRLLDMSVKTVALVDMRELDCGTTYHSASARGTRDL
jgi:hypothetical protein